MPKGWRLEGALPLTISVFWSWGLWLLFLFFFAKIFLNSLEPLIFPIELRIDLSISAKRCSWDGFRDWVRSVGKLWGLLPCEQSCSSVNVEGLVVELPCSCRMAESACDTKLLRLKDEALHSDITPWTGGTVWTGTRRHSMDSVSGELRMLHRTDPVALRRMPCVLGNTVYTEEPWWIEEPPLEEKF